MKLSACGAALFIAIVILGCKKTASNTIAPELTGGLFVEISPMPDSATLNFLSSSTVAITHPEALGFQTSSSLTASYYLQDNKISFIASIGAQRDTALFWLNPPVKDTLELDSCPPGGNVTCMLECCLYFKRQN